MTVFHEAAVAADGRSDQPEWRDQSFSVPERAEALLAALSLEEKVAQLGSVWLTTSAGDFAPTLDDTSSVRTAELEVQNGLGQITRAYGTTALTVAEGAARLRQLQATVIASSRLGIPAIAHEECLTGFAAFGATAFPTPLAWAASFDGELVREMATAIGSDLAAVGVHQGLAPVLDVVRDYRWGRVEETMGEDPYLVGQLGAAYVAGLESAGIISTLKHFAGYAASRGARNHGPVSMGLRELEDIVLPPFETALRNGGARSVMNAYTDLDGVPAAANADLLTGLLRDRWGFEGTVVADYWAVPFLATMHRVAADAAEAGLLSITAGLDVELPETRSYGSTLVDYVRSGRLDESVVDRAVLRHLKHKVEAGLLDMDVVVPAGADAVDLDSQRNRDIARRLAEQSVVLLADDGLALPLSKHQRIAVIGPGADESRSLLGCYSFPNHVLAGESNADFGIQVPSVFSALSAELPEALLVHERGVGFFGSDTSGISDAAAAAAAADAALLVVGDIAGLFGKGTSGEGCDVADLRLPGAQHELVMAVLATGVPVVLLVLSGRPYALGEYLAAGAMVQSFFPGQEGAGAICGLLSGRVAPSGRLPVQIPALPSMVGPYLQPPLGLKSTGITVLDPTPLFAFGHGLTPGQIAYEAIAADAGVIGTAGLVEISVTVSNSGDTEAVEVVQLYEHDPVAEIVRTDIRLIGFARIPVAAGSTRTVTFRVHADRLSFTGRDGLRIVEPGAVVFSAGPSAARRPLSVAVEVDGAVRIVDEGRVLATEWSVATH